MRSDWPSSQSGILRIGLVGKPGAGKSTAARHLQEVYSAVGLCVRIVKLAAPLYDMQNAFYDRLDGRRVQEQDGALLNFFGQHFRNVDPDALINDFAERCTLAYLGNAQVLICDDVRPVDVSKLRDLGFLILGISAPLEMRQARRHSRGDMTLGDENHSTEQGMGDISFDQEIFNDGGLVEFETTISEFAQTMKRQVPRTDLAVSEDLCQYVVPVIQAKLHKYLEPKYREHRHQIASLIIAENGRHYFGLHVEASVGRASSCAENGALSQFCADGHQRAILVASYRLPRPGWTDPPKFVAPCGICRELLTDHTGDPFVIISSGSDINMPRLRSLLPEKYIGTKWAKPVGSDT